MVDKYLAPIPLTEDILINAGFEKEAQEDWDGDVFNVYFKDGVTIHEGNNPKEFLYPTYVKGTQESFKGGVGVDSVHHLQNIFQTLTNQELNIIL